MMMIGEQTRPAIGKFIVAGNRARLIMDTSPRTPLNNLHGVGGVGLGIVAALVEKPGNMMMNGGETPAKKKAFCGRNNLNRSDPIPVAVNNYSGGGGHKHNNNNDNDIIDRGGGGGVVDENTADRLEEYTYVTCHKPNNSIYRDGGEYYRRSSGGDGGGCLFEISPASFGDSITVYPAAASDDFLSSCHLCHKKLHGKDIYMFRGEKAFCSTECRYKHIEMEERREHCSSQASRSSSSSAAADVSISPCTNGHIFSTGILAI